MSVVTVTALTKALEGLLWLCVPCTAVVADGVPCFALDSSTAGAVTAAAAAAMVLVGWICKQVAASVLPPTAQADTSANATAAAACDGVGWLTVQVTASVPWPMTGTIEALMADQAKKTVGQYVDWIGKYVEAALEDINNLRQAQQQAAGEMGLGSGCCSCVHGTAECKGFGCSRPCWCARPCGQAKASLGGSCWWCRALFAASQ